MVMATVNRYMASLSTVFTYAVKECGWIQTNPMLRVYKLKEAWGRDRILSKDECDQLLASCAKSRNKLLLPIVVLAVTTSLRQAEILNLTWNDVLINSKNESTFKDAWASLHKVLLSLSNI